MEHNCGTCNRPISSHSVDQLEVCAWIGDDEWCLACRRLFDDHSPLQLLHCLELLEAACEELGVE